MVNQLQDIALVIAAHGDRGEGERNRVLMAHRAKLDANGTFRAVLAGVLKGEPPIEDAVSKASATNPEQILIYPFFMADGYFVNSVLRKRVSALVPPDQARLLAPLGLDPRIAGVIIEEARSAAELSGMAPSSARLIVAGHGSKFGPASARATRTAAQRVSDAGVFGDVAVAFLEEEPFLEDQLTATSGGVIVSGFFSGEGMHAGDDVPDAIARAGSTAIYSGPVGRAGIIPDLIRSSVSAALV